ncbi:MAG: flagellar hook protein FlgE [Burkholderiales bacterium]|nr:flagellar hook protein FlgE [Burkholderiales bacterium]
MSFQQGLSGLNSTSKNLSVIGNNIANANTFGFKGSRAEFAAVYATSLNAAGGNAAGIGVNVTAVAQQFTQGNIATTENAMDLAINGRGFFQLQRTNGDTPIGQVMYSRSGQFKVDRDGYVVDTAGLKLLARKWDAVTNRATGEATTISLKGDTGGKPAATGAGVGAAYNGIRITMNLDARQDAPTDAMDFTLPDTYNYSTSQTLYDSQGAPLTMTYYYRKTGANAWDVFGTINDVPIDGAGGTGLITSLTFDVDGALSASTNATMDIVDPRTPPLDAAAAFLFDDLPLDMAKSTQYASSFGVNELTQDGYAAGELTGIQFDDSGVIKATYSNGRANIVGQLQLADFTNLQGLAPTGGNLWAETFSSGAAIRGEPGSSSLGALQSGALEESNVDLTAELVNMITAQRAYQANAQTIKTEDQVLQTLVNLR